MKCDECGKIMMKVSDDSVSYECECEHYVRRLTEEKSKLFAPLK
ncbi:MAG: hypothetical protein QXX08_01140 [Candidatus Bathyarchaeia archaeon]